ncbi:E3 RID-beta [Simian adenovirus 20]|uniref:E3 RID-beta n=1 Tax=Simian adenovirus 20 TaxID=585059 RepID=F6KSV8_9ADEN|nr:E3 RID-beta [Simian adenovirus 20]AEF59063.1 E3 RID-beta [Simian adenovirus 20]
MIFWLFIFCFFTPVNTCEFTFTQFWKLSCLDSSMSNEWIMAAIMGCMATFSLVCGIMLHSKFKTPWTHGFLTDLPVNPDPTLNANPDPPRSPSVYSYFHL